MATYHDRMAEAEQAEEQGKYREAMHLYRRIGEDSRTLHGQLDPRTLDAFEGMARVISAAGEADRKASNGTPKKG